MDTAYVRENPPTQNSRLFQGTREPSILGTTEMFGDGINDYFNTIGVQVKLWDLGLAPATNMASWLINQPPRSEIRVEFSALLRESNA